MERKSQTGAVKTHVTKQLTITATPTPDQIVEAMQRTIQRVRRMSHAQRVQSMKEAGILTTSGKLSACYK